MPVKWALCLQRARRPFVHASLSVVVTCIPAPRATPLTRFSPDHWPQSHNRNRITQSSYKKRNFDSEMLIVVRQQSGNKSRNIIESCVGKAHHHRTSNVQHIQLRIARRLVLNHKSTLVIVSLSCRHHLEYNNCMTSHSVVGDIGLIKCRHCQIE